MTVKEQLNFLLTNRIPRRWLTLAMARFSKIERPWVRDASIALWSRFSDLNLSEAKKTRFSSVHDCFTRELAEGMRPVDPDPSILVSPCDAIIGATGPVRAGDAFQAKGFSYSLQELLGDAEAAARLENGTYVTLRLTASMYHRFHAPYECTVRTVRYFSGDTWNVNPAALKRVERLFCKNERAVIRCELKGLAHGITLVPVAAVLVASIRLHFLNVLLHLRYRGPADMTCQAQLRKGEEMGWFEHGSTIIVLAPAGFALCAALRPGDRINVGRPLLMAPT